MVPSVKGKDRAHQCLVLGDDFRPGHSPAAPESRLNLEVLPKLHPTVVDQVLGDGLSQ